MKKTILISATILITIIACKTKKEVAKDTATAVEGAKPVLDCSTSGLTYADIKPIFDKQCISCHDYGGGAGGYNFTSIGDVKRAGTNGELLGTIKWKRGFPLMPKNDEQLGQASIDLIECWIKNGMKE